MIPIKQLEIVAMDFGLDENEWSQALEWAYLCAIKSDVMLTKEMKLLTKDSDPKDEGGRTWVPDNKELRRRLLELYHDTPISSHLGIQGTYKLVSQGYWWENMHDYIKQYMLILSMINWIYKKKKKIHAKLPNMHKS